MCGINGILAPDAARKYAATISTMNQAIRHRGPDGEGSHAAGDIVLGHRRLAIIDLSDAGHQPMCDQTGHIWVSMNGEIYNFRDLRRELEAEGRVFKTQSDTEVLVQGFAAWGAEIFSRLEGLFAAAVWDGDNVSIQIGRAHV